MESLLYVAVAHAGSIGDAPKAATLLRNILDFVLSIAGIAGIIALVVAGSLYLSAGGDMRRAMLAKRAAIASVIGIAVVLSAWIIIDQLAAFFS